MPFWFKEIVDSLNMDVGEAGTVWLVVGWSVLGCAWPFSLPRPARFLSTRSTREC